MILSLIDAVTAVLSANLLTSVTRHTTMNSQREIGFSPDVPTGKLRRQRNSFDNDSAMLLEELRTLERELHKHQTRRNRKRMETLLHPDFVEFGRSAPRQRASSHSFPPF